MDVLKTYLALSSLVLAFSFIFQNSIRTVRSPTSLPCAFHLAAWHAITLNPK